MTEPHELQLLRELFDSKLEPIKSTLERLETANIATNKKLDEHITGEIQALKSDFNEYKTGKTEAKKFNLTTALAIVALVIAIIGLTPKSGNPTGSSIKNSPPIQRHIPKNKTGVNHNDNINNPNICVFVPNRNNNKVAPQP